MGSVRCKHINPKVLRWARETAGYRVDQVLVFSDSKQLEKYERGEDFPTYDQLEELASYYERPLALLFFPEIPEEEIIKHSFRSSLIDEPDKYPAIVKLALRKGEAFRLRLHNLTNSENPAKELITDIIKSTGYHDVDKLAIEARKALGTSLSRQKDWSSSGEAFEHWRDKLADKGVFVLEQSFSDRTFASFLRGYDYSGFCIYDEQFPIIVVNKFQPKNRQIFTLFHELAHLIFFRIDPSTIEQDLETPCNGFAAEFLLPYRDFDEEARQLDNDLDAVDKLALLYCVSRHAILVKMLERNIISQRTYKEWERVIENSVAPKQEQKADDKKDDSLCADKIAHLGKSYIKLVLGKYQKQEITLGEAADHLYIKPSQVNQLKDEFYGKR